MDLGKDIDERVIEEKIKLQRANECAAVVFSVCQPLNILFSLALVCYRCREYIVVKNFANCFYYSLELQAVTRVS